MICPKCELEQPDDIYCAFCGVNIERYLRQRRKKRHKAYVLTALIGVVGLLVAKYIMSGYHVESPELTAKHADKKSVVPIKETSFPEAKPDRLVSEYKPPAQTETDQRPKSQRLSSSFIPDSREDKRPSGDELPRKPPPPDQQEAKPPDKQQGETYTPAEWFEKGKALDDESDAEIECYKKAIELDPEFAVAYYRLGAIYYRRANYELADQEFAKFLKHASEADKEAHSIYVYYSPADVERLFEEKVVEKAPAEEAKKETRAEAEGSEKKEASQAEEAKKVTPSEAEKAEEETPVEVEGVEEETAAEAEEAEKQTPSEAEKETEEPVSEETGQETSEEVMTIVRFSRIDGHVTVPVVLNGFLEARVLLDTGSGITVISRELARKLHMEEEPGHTITLKTIAMDIDAQRATLDSIQVGDLIENNFPVAITDLPLGEKSRFDGILGMDFMNNYTIHIDNRNNRMVLTPSRKKDE